MAIRIYLATAAGIITFMALCLIPVAFFGDKNESWTKRLIIVGGIAALIFLLAIFW